MTSEDNNSNKWEKGVVQKCQCRAVINDVSNQIMQRG